MIESNPSATFSLIFRITNLQNLLASRLKIPWRPIKPRPLDLQGPIFVSSSPSQASVMQRRLNGAVSEKKKNSFPVHNLRSDDHHKSIIYASSATQSSRIPSFLKPRPHATEGPWLLLPPHPSKKKKEPLPSESTTLAATHALIRRIANIAKVGIPSTSTPTNPRSRWGLAFPTFNNPLAATWYTPSILNVKDGSHSRSAKLKTE